MSDSFPARKRGSLFLLFPTPWTAVGGVGNASARFPSSGGRVLGVHGCVTVHGLSRRRPLRAGAETRSDRALCVAIRRYRKAAAARYRNRLLISPSKRSVVGVVEEMVKQKLVRSSCRASSSTSSAGSEGSALRDLWGVTVADTRDRPVELRRRYAHRRNPLPVLSAGSTSARLGKLASSDLTEEPGLRRLPVPHDCLRRDV